LKETEFKSWFTGFSEGIGNKPNAAQWERIKEMVAKIDGKAVTEIVYRDWYYGHPWYHNNIWWGSVGGTAVDGHNHASLSTVNLNEIAVTGQTRKIPADAGMREGIAPEETGDSMMYHAGRMEAEGWGGL